MSMTLYFRDSARMQFPDLCIGCGKEGPEKRLKWIVFSIPSLSTGAKAFKAANVALGLTAGGIGGALGGAHLGNTLKKARAVAQHAVPICVECNSSVSVADLKKISEVSEELFGKNGVGIPVFHIRVGGEHTEWSPVNEGFAKALSKLNPGRVFASLDECLASHPLQALPYARQPLQVIDDESIGRFESLYERKLSPLEVAIVDAWHARVGQQPSIYTYPNIPSKKLSNAVSGYAHEAATELIIGLQDSTLFGSAKDGALFTSKGIYWKSVGPKKEPECVLYTGIAPSSVTFESSIAKKYVVLGPGKRMELSMNADERPLLALCSFIIDAAEFSRS